MPWLYGWRFRKRIQISGSPGAGEGYQVFLRIGESPLSANVDVHTGGGSPNFPHDLRFTGPDGLTVLPYWIEDVEGYPPARVAKVWVRVNVSLDSNNYIFLYYGNPSAKSESDASATFVRVLDNVVAVYHMDEGQGSVLKDSSGNGYDLTIVGSNYAWSPGRREKSLKLLGVTYAQTQDIPTPLTTGQGTISFWVKFFSSDTARKMNFLSSQYSSGLGDVVQDSGSDVIHLSPSTHTPGYAFTIQLPSGLHGWMSYRMICKVADNTTQNTVWVVETYEDGVLSWSFSRTADKYPNTTQYVSMASPLRFFDGSKSYEIKVYWSGSVEVYMKNLLLVAKRGAVGFSHPSFFFVGFGDHEDPSTVRVFSYSKNADGSPSYSWFGSSILLQKDDQWHHVLVTVDGTTKKVFVDGNLAGEVSVSGLYQGTTRIRVGANWDYIYGEVDDVVMMSRALTDQEVQDLYTHHPHTANTMPGKILLRKRVDPEPSVSLSGFEEPSVFHTHPKNIWVHQTASGPVLAVEYQDAEGWVYRVTRKLKDDLSDFEENVWKIDGVFDPNGRRVFFYGRGFRVRRLVHLPKGKTIFPGEEKVKDIVLSGSDASYVEQKVREAGMWPPITPVPVGGK